MNANVLTAINPVDEKALVLVCLPVSDYVSSQDRLLSVCWWFLMNSTILPLRVEFLCLARISRKTRTFCSV